MSWGLKSLVAAAGLILMGICAGGWFFRPSDVSTPEPEEIEEPSREELSTQTIRRMEQRVTRLEAERVGRYFAEQVETSPEEENAAATPQKVHPQPAPTEEEVEAEHLERLNSEPVDRDWEEEIENKIDELIDIPALENTKVTDVSCGSTTCQMNVSYGGAQEQETFMQIMMFEMGNYNGFSRNIESNGQLKSRFYLTKASPVKYIDKDGNEYHPEG
jgi:hypothetical protein